MAIKLDVIEDGSVNATLQISGSDAVVLKANPVPSAILKENVVQSQVINVMKGLPGLPNVYVGPTPPENPFENMIWIDTSAG